MLRFVTAIERWIVRALIVLLLISIVLGTLALGRVLLMEITRPPILLFDIPTLFEAFGLFLVILIGIELLRSMTMFLTEDHIKPELVVEVAVIALCNKIITLDLKHTSGELLLGLAVMFIGLSAAYYVLHGARIGYFDAHAARDAG